MADRAYLSVRRGAGWERICGGASGLGSIGWDSTTPFLRISPLWRGVFGVGGLVVDGCLDLLAISIVIEVRGRRAGNGDETVFGIVG